MNPSLTKRVHGLRLAASLVLCVLSLCHQALAADADNKRFRLIWSSDFPPIPVTNSDPDDVQSIVRLLTYSNELDIEGFIASAGTYGMVANKSNLNTVWDAYAKVQDNLKKYDSRYPNADKLRAITYEGKGNNNGVSIKWECNKQPAENLIGAGKDSEGSNAIIAAADKPDTRPLWIGVAGGPREVAQAIWKVRSTRSAADANAFISKLRVFLIACQDSTHQYIMNVPNLFVIESKNSYQGFFCDGNALCNSNWLDTNIRFNHGPLAALYPPKGAAITGVQEGDSPAFMHLISAMRGINDAENPAQGGWGGTYRRDGSSNRWLDAGGASIKAGLSQYQAEFALRADWMVAGAPLPSSKSSSIASSSKPASLISSSTSSASKVSSSLVSSRTSVSSSAIVQSSKASSSAATTGDPVVVAINAGGQAVTYKGVNYRADAYFTGGLISTTKEDIRGTTEDALFQDERYGTYAYRIPVTAGSYSVEMQFAEIYHNAQGKRSFNVSIEGQQLLSRVDLFAYAGRNGIYTYEAKNIAVNDGYLDINLETLIDNAQIAGFVVRSATGKLIVNQSSSSSSSTSNTATGSKIRLINTTDLGADPDDQQSLVHQLVMANEFDLEGLVVSTSCWRKNQSDTSMLDKIVNAYGQALPNLKKHAEGFPSVEYLKSISALGQRGYGMADVGAGKDSAGSNLIIAAADKNDARPLWVSCWGGCNTLAQAIWKVQNTRSVSDLNKFISKLRVYDVLGQDDAGAWMTKNFPELFFIRATGVYGWQPSDAWLASNVQNHGALGAAYPNRIYAAEGDSPAFMYLVPNGLSDPEKVDQGNWGGRFDTAKKSGIRSMQPVTNEAQYDTYRMFGNTGEGSGAISRWRAGYENNFAARMDWSISGNYADANHHPVAVVNANNTRDVIYLNAAAGTSLKLDANGSRDPDGHSLNFNWSVYTEPSSYKGGVTIQNNSAAQATLQVPGDAKGKNIHVIFTLRDSGSPNLYAYRRVVVQVQ